MSPACFYLARLRARMMPFDPPESPLKRGTLKSEAPFLRGLGGSKVQASYAKLLSKSSQVFSSKKINPTLFKGG